jgi:hypothetical protein
VTELELVLREVSLLRSDLRAEISAERDFREALDNEVSELRLKVDRLERPQGVNVKRDGGLALSASAITGIITAVISALMNTAPTPPSPPRPAPTHLTP